MMMLNPIHHSTMHRIRIPSGFGRAKINDADRVFVEKQALEIFTAMTNRGASFQQSLCAIFLSGMDAGVCGQEARRE